MFLHKFYKLNLNLYYKGVIGCDMHFYKLFELKCVLAVCTQTPYSNKDPPSVFF